MIRTAVLLHNGACLHAGTPKVPPPLPYKGPPRPAKPISAPTKPPRSAAKLPKDSSYEPPPLPLQRGTIPLTFIIWILARKWFHPINKILWHFNRELGVSLTGSSNFPTIAGQRQEMVWMQKFRETPKSLRKGDFVTCIPWPNLRMHYEKEGPGENSMSKRIAGLPGDVMRHGNSRLVGFNYPYILPRQPLTSTIQVIPKNYVWLLGDNAPVSADSRHFGVLSVSSVISKVLWRWDQDG